MSEPKDQATATECSSHCYAVFGFREWVILAVLVGLAAHGGVTIMEDTGVLVWRFGEYQFWFEEDVRRWIHGI